MDFQFTLHNLEFFSRVDRCVAGPSSRLDHGLHGTNDYRPCLYSRQAPLYKFMQTTPKISMIAGPPDLMDDVLTFGQRKAFVTYKLSHTWYLILTHNRGCWTPEVFEDVGRRREP